MLLLLELLDPWQRPIKAEMVVRRDTAELRCRDHLAGVADREALGEWLGTPRGVLAYDDVTWLGLSDGIALYIGDFVSGHILEPGVVEGLRCHLAVADLSSPTAPPIELSEHQLELLRFLADNDRPPRQMIKSRYDRLIAHGFVELDDRTRYQVTELGLRHLATLR